MITKFIDLSDYWKAMVEKLDKDNQDEESRTAAEIDRIKTEYIDEFGSPIMAVGSVNSYDFYNNGRGMAKK